MKTQKKGTIVTQEMVVNSAPSDTYTISCTVCTWKSGGCVSLVLECPECHSRVTAIKCPDIKIEP